MTDKVNIGCGTTPIDGWINFDNSYAIKLANSPLLYQIAKIFKLLNKKQIENIEWNKKHKIKFADASKIIPLKNNSAECIYTSHMLEHISRDGASMFLREALRVLKTDGILRISVPDLNIAIINYLKDGDANEFMEYISVEARPIGNLREKLQLLISGYRHHQWMYDGKSLSILMETIGFRNVKIYKKGETSIKNPKGLDLYERCEESVYVEGIK